MKTKHLAKKLISLIVLSMVALTMSIVASAALPAALTDYGTNYSDYYNVQGDGTKKITTVLLEQYTIIIYLQTNFFSIQHRRRGNLETLYI